jgi:hypothetical protein
MSRIIRLGEFDVGVHRCRGRADRTVLNQATGALSGVMQLGGSTDGPDVGYPNDQRSLRRTDQLES